MSTAITPEVVGLKTTILEDSPMTEVEEKELVFVKTTIKTAYADKLERDLAIGAGLLQIFRRKLYRGPSGGRNWEQWLADESAELTAGRDPLLKPPLLCSGAFISFVAKCYSVVIRITTACLCLQHPSMSALCLVSLRPTLMQRWRCGKQL